MKYIYAALLLHSSSKPIDEENVKNVLKAAGTKVEDSRVKALTAALLEVDIEEAIKTASTVMISQPSPASAPTPAEEKREKPKTEEKKEGEEALDGLGNLFG